MKYTKTIIAAALALTMTACSDTNTSELVDLPDITESSTVLTEKATTVEETIITTTTITTTTAELTTVSETETTEDETEALEEVEIDITGSHILSVGNYNIDCTISTSNWNGNDIEFTNKQKALINNFFINSDTDELYNIINNGAEKLMAESVPDIVRASFEDFCFLDCNDDGEEEMLAVLELYNVSDGLGNPYVVCYVDNSKVSFVFDGAHVHRSVFFTAVDSQPFIISAEVPGMGYSVDPVIEVQKAFTYSNGGFVPYTLHEGKSLCIRIGEYDNRLYLFNTDVNNNTEYYYMDEIAAGDIEQTLGWVNGNIKVIDGFEAE